MGGKGGRTWGKWGESVLESLFPELSFEVSFPFRCKLCLHAHWSYSGWLLSKHNSSALLCILQFPSSQEENKRVFYYYWF